MQKNILYLFHRGEDWSSEVIFLFIDEGLNNTVNKQKSLLQDYKAEMSRGVTV